MIGRIFTVLIYFLLIIPVSILSQNIAISDQLKYSINENIKGQLLSALDTLVLQINRNNINPSLVWKNEDKFTRAVLEDVHLYESTYQDSLSHMDRTLLNTYPIGEGRHLCQIAYFNQGNDESNSLKMILNVIAHTENKDITFSTPLSYYTDSWEEKKVGSISYYYRDKFRSDRAKKYARKNELFSTRFQLKPNIFKFFMVDNYQEIIRLMGLDYNAKSIGIIRDGYGVIADEYIFSVMNNEDFSHDLFHYYSGRIHDSSTRNWVAEEGLAYSWGNAYYTRDDGEMAEQKELLELLKQYLSQNINLDLLELLENNFWSDKSGIYEHLAPDFNVGRLISSLICDEVYRKHGMEGTNRLISCGSNPNHFDSFLNITDQLIGLNRSNFNKKVKRLISDFR